jgi:Protein of unknown function (DUF3717)
MNIRGLLKKRTTLRPSVRAAVSAATSDVVGGAAAGPSIPLVTISEIEVAINSWRDRKPSNDSAALCFEARKLADVYGFMIFTRQNEVELSSLNNEQRAALAGAFA